MKKSRQYRALKWVFWLCMAAAAAWVALTPAPPVPSVAPVRVKVEQTAPPSVPVPAETPPAPAATGDEKSQVTESVPPSQVEEEKAPPHNLAKIAIVIDDVGLDMKGSQRAIDLPGFITLSFMPYALRLREQTKEAREEGHELMLHMPMEPIGHEDPGPGALLVGLPPEELRERFDTALSSFIGFDGVNNHMGSKFTADSDGMALVVDELLPRHLFFLDSRTSAKSVGAMVARQRGLPTISRDVFLDDDMSLKAINRQLAQTEHLARIKGYAVAIGHPHAVTLDALEQWLPEVQKRGFTLVPVHDLIHSPTTIQKN